MTYTLEPLHIVLVVVALLVGIFLGMALRSGAKRRAVLFEERLRVSDADRSALAAERDGLRAERDALDQRLTPLAAEVDRLKRAEAKRVAPIGVTEDPVAVRPAASLAGNDVRNLKGVGDRFAKALSDLGITGVDQIAAWSGADADVIDSQLGSFSGRIRTDRLVEQARLLHEGRTTEYETRFGALGA